MDVRQGDGAALDLPDASVDTVICASAVYTFPDILAALAEWKRVLKLGGRLACSTLGAGSDRLYRQLLQRYGMPLPAELPTQRVDTPEKCVTFLRNAGFEGTESHLEQLGYYVPDPEQCWEIIWYTGARIPLTYFPASVVERLRTDYLAAMAAAATDRGIWVHWPTVFTIGRKP